MRPAGHRTDSSDTLLTTLLISGQNSFLRKKPGVAGKGWTTAAETLTRAQDSHTADFFQRTSHTLTFTPVPAGLALLEHTGRKIRGLEGLLTAELEKLITRQTLGKYLLKE